MLPSTLRTACLSEMLRAEQNANSAQGTSSQLAHRSQPELATCAAILVEQKGNLSQRNHGEERVEPEARHERTFHGKADSTHQLLVSQRERQQLSPAEHEAPTLLEGEPGQTRRDLPPRQLRVEKRIQGAQRPETGTTTAN